MQIDMQARPFEITPAMEARVARHLRAIESRFGERIGQVLVRMDDINGERGGVDKRCRIVIEAIPRQTVVAEALSADMYASISQAARRAETALSRTLQRRRTRSPRRLLMNPDQVDAEDARSASL